MQPRNTHTLAHNVDQREWREIRALNGVDFRLVKAAASSGGILQRGYFGRTSRRAMDGINCRIYAHWPIIHF